MKKFLFMASIFILFGCSEEANKSKDASDAQAQVKTDVKIADESLKVEKVIITTQSGEVAYNVEVAKEIKDLARGLMGRESLAADAGMKFVFEPAEGIAMWMKNTLIPLDMLFVDADGKIICIKENATPMSEEHIKCEGVTAVVFEINGGDVAKNKIKVGDSVK